MNYIANSKRIANNTFFLYIRMFFLMCVTLYTSRVVLDVLGVVDYGIYNVVGGLTASFAFFSSSLANATQRFLNIEISKNDSEGISRVYSSSIIIYTIAILCVFAAAEGIGYWLLNNKLVIPPDRVEAANWVLQTTIIGLVVTLIGSIYDSILIAHENMEVYAYLSILESILRLIIAFIIPYIDIDKLKLYAVLYLATMLFIRLIMVMYCKRKYPDCVFKLRQKGCLMKEILSFIGWNGLGTAVWMINEHGINVLLNIFFGPMVNAARGISAQAGAAINNFSTNFFTAIRPQIIKSYAAHDFNFFYKLIYAGSKYSFYLIWIISLPIILRSNDILELWLKEVPDYADSFVKWITIFYCVNVLTNPLWSAVQAIGNLKKYVIIGSLVFLSAFPISYTFLHYGASPVVIFQILVVSRLTYLIVSIWIIKGMIEFSIKQYISNSIWPILKVLALTSTIVYMINMAISHSFIGLIIITLISVSITIVVIYAVGIEHNERDIINSKLRLIAHNVTSRKRQN